MNERIGQWRHFCVLDIEINRFEYGLVMPWQTPSLLQKVSIGGNTDKRYQISTSVYTQQTHNTIVQVWLEVDGDFQADFSPS